MKIKHIANSDSGVFEVMDNGFKIGELTYLIKEFNTTVLIANHTWVNPNFRGLKIGDQLVVKLIEFANQNRFTINPVCPFISRFFDLHPEYLHFLSKE